MPGQWRTLSAAPATTDGDAAPKKRLSTSPLVAFAFGLIVVVAIVVYAIPKYADYGAVWEAMKTLTPIEFWSLLGATIFNLYTYWLANQAGLIGMGLGQSAVVTQTSTTVANTLPAGGAFGVGVTAAMLNTWGFTAGEITLFVGSARQGDALAYTASAGSGEFAVGKGYLAGAWGGYLPGRITDIRLWAGAVTDATQVETLIGY